MGYTPSTLLNKLYNCMAWNAAYLPLPYNVFKTIMMGDEDYQPVMTYERTVKEKYRLLQELGYISKTGMLDTERAKDCIGVA